MAKIKIAPSFCKIKDGVFEVHFNTGFVKSGPTSAIFNGVPGDTPVYDGSKEKKVSDYVRPSGAVWAFTLDGNFVNEFPSANKAAKALGVARQHIDLCMRGRGNSVKDFTFLPAGILDKRLCEEVIKEFFTPKSLLEVAERLKG